MGAKQSSHNGRANARNVANGGALAATGLPESSRVVALDPRIRTRSLNNVGHSLSIPGHSASLQESDLSSSPEDNLPSPRGLAIQGAHSLPSHLFATYTSFLNGRINYICTLGCHHSSSSYTFYSVFCWLEAVDRLRLNFLRISFSFRL